MFGPPPYRLTMSSILPLPATIQIQQTQDPSVGAWYLAVALISSVDLSQAKRFYELSVPLEDIFNATQEPTHAWLQEATGRACGFNIVVHDSFPFEAADSDSYSMFLNVGFRPFPKRIVAELHGGALWQLQQLQAGIRQLHSRDQLRPANLTKLMKKLVPLTSFKMKKDVRYHHGNLFGDLVSHRGEIRNA
jgi:hypothetical protein